MCVARGGGGGGGAGAGRMRGYLEGHIPAISSTFQWMHNYYVIPSIQFCAIKKWNK